MGRVSTSPRPTSMRTEAVARCVACGASGSHVHRVRDRRHGIGEEWSYRRCDSCRTLWLDPRPIAADIHQAYPDDYFTHETRRNHAIADGRFLSGRTGTARRAVLSAVYGYHDLAPPTRGRRLLGRVLGAVPAVRRRAVLGLDGLVPPMVPDGRLLDFGCGDGSFLAVMRSLGWHVAGVDDDPGAREHARLLYDLHVAPSLDALPPGEFDVAVLKHVLEHVHEPAELLACVAERVRPGGRVLVAVPSATSLSARLYGEAAVNLEPPRHLALYTRAGLRRLAGRVPALADVEVRSSTHDAAWMFRESHRRRHGPPTGRRARRVERWRCRALARLEGALNPFAAVGEELVLRARRAGP